VCEESTDALAEELFDSYPQIRHRADTGYYLKAYVGHVESQALRSTVASGGLTTAVLEGLLSKGDVENVIAVRPTGRVGSKMLFESAVVSTAEGLRECAGSCYYPVSFQTALREAASSQSSYAIVGLPCVCRAVRLAQKKSPRLRNIRYVLALTCGTSKSTFFTDYIATTVGVEPKKVVRICYRDKSRRLPVVQYPTRIAFRDKASGDIHYKYTTWLHGRIAAAFTTRLFSPLACNFCDDVFGECADATFMDAWLGNYGEQPLGTSIALFRNPALLERFMLLPGIRVDDIPIDQVIASQAGALDAKRIGLAVRYHDALRRGEVIPSVREHVLPPFRRIPLLRCWRYRLQHHMSRISFFCWRKSRGCPDLFWKLLWLPWQTYRVLGRVMRIFPKRLYQLRK